MWTIFVVLIILSGEVNKNDAKSREKYTLYSTHRYILLMDSIQSAFKGIARNNEQIKTVEDDIEAFVTPFEKFVKESEITRYKGLESFEIFHDIINFTILRSWVTQIDKYYDELREKFFKSTTSYSKIGVIYHYEYIVRMMKRMPKVFKIFNENIGEHSSFYQRVLEASFLRRFESVNK